MIGEGLVGGAKLRVPALAALKEDLGVGGLVHSVLEAVDAGLLPAQLWWTTIRRTVNGETFILKSRHNNNSF